MTDDILNEQNGASLGTALWGKFKASGTTGTSGWQQALQGKLASRMQQSRLEASKKFDDKIEETTADDFAKNVINAFMRKAPEELKDDKQLKKDLDMFAHSYFNLLKRHRLVQSQALQIPQQQNARRAVNYSIETLPHFPY